MSLDPPAFLRGQNLNNKLNIAIIGCGGCGRKLEWDPVAFQARGVPAADPLIRKSYRQGWKLDALPAGR